MKIINREMSLKEFAMAVAKALKSKNIDVILTGGAVVSIYSRNKYISNDADFVSETDHQTIKAVMIELGFKAKGKDFFHEDSNFSVEFPGTQLMIGDTSIEPKGRLNDGKFVLKLLSPTQCVMDRLAAFYHWNDRQGLEQAVLVAIAHPIKLKSVEVWSKKEGMEERFIVFKKALKVTST